MHNLKFKVNILYFLAEMYKNNYWGVCKGGTDIGIKIVFEALGTMAKEALILKNKKLIRTCELLDLYNPDNWDDDTNKVIKELYKQSKYKRSNHDKKH